jgi:16S rRNA (guanine527-N7)-methyltransferase
VRDALAALMAVAPEVLGRSLSEDEHAHFGRYLDLLLEWQRVHRLVGSASTTWIVEKLFVDSLLFLRVLPTAFGALLDLGSGAGIPGIPLKIVRPETKLTMIESRRRRASFLSTVVRELRLEDTRVICERAERAARDLARTFDAVVLRCAGDPGEVLPLAIQFLRPGGVAVAAGPPVPRPLNQGRWVTVPAPGRSGQRNFAVMQA